MCIRDRTWLRDTYPTLPPIYITENGRACDDVVAPDGQVDDPDRVRYLDGHLRAVADAIDAGVDVRVYYCWSLMDNFEWAEGYSKRFGVVYVDYATQQRTTKASFRWFCSLIDNFELAVGYSKRCGLVYVNYATQQRTPKVSFSWLRSLIADQHGRDAG